MAVATEAEISSRRQQELTEHNTTVVVRNLEKSFVSPTGEPIDVLRGVSFEANGGETIAITGPSGAGKSTLLHLLGGLESYDKGAVIIAGVAIETLHGNALARFRNQQLGFVFQFHYLLPDLTAAENVAVPLMVGRLSQSEAMRRARNSLKEVGLEDRLDHPVSHLSGGEQQRVAVSRALIHQPKLVLADEPTGNLDSGIEEEINSRLISYAKAHNRIVVIATHHERLAAMCNRVFVLKDGTIHPQ